MDDSVPFCPACGAPQIRVASRESKPAEAGDSTGIPPPPQQAEQAEKEIAAPVLPAPGQVHWRTLLRIALPLAAPVGFLTWIQPGLGWLIALPGAIVVAINFYRRRQLCFLSAWLGAKMGAVVGLLSFVFFSLVFALSGAIDGPAFRQAMEKLGQEALARYPTPESHQLAQAWFTGPHGVAVIAGTILASMLFFVLAIGTITGALVGALSRRQNIP